VRTYLGEEGFESWKTLAPNMGYARFAGRSRSKKRTEETPGIVVREDPVLEGSQEIAGIRV